MKDEIPSYAIHTENLIAGFFGPFRFMSNFPDAPVEYLGVRYPSTEVAYQAAKCITEAERLQFQGIGSSEAKKLGNQITLRSDWELVKKKIMFYLVFQKFSRHNLLRRQLLATGSALLIESNHWRDTYWGEAFKQVKGGEWLHVGGENHLGKILVEVRAILK